MSNELELHHNNDTAPAITDDGLELLQKQAEAMSAAHKLATVLCNTSMVPAVFRGKPDDGAAAILYGSELGLKPQQALQQVFVVHGQPAIYARTMVALLKAKGYKFQTLESSIDCVTVRGESPRGEVEEASWTIDRAKKAGYTSNKKYDTDPQAMLYAKAASEVCRKLAPDVLLGIRYTAEDLELEPQPIKARAERVDAKPNDLYAALGVKKDKAEGSEDEAATRDVLESFTKRFTNAKSKTALDEAARAAQAQFAEDSDELTTLHDLYITVKNEKGW